MVNYIKVHQKVLEMPDDLKKNKKSFMKKFYLNNI